MTRQEQERRNAWNDGVLRQAIRDKNSAKTFADALKGETAIEDANALKEYIDHTPVKIWSGLRLDDATKARFKTEIDAVLANLEKAKDAEAEEEKRARVDSYRDDIFQGFEDLRDYDDADDFTPPIFGTYAEFHPATLNLLIARPSVGKTTALVTMETYARRKLGRKILHVNGEETRRQFVSRSTLCSFYEEIAEEAKKLNTTADAVLAQYATYTNNATGKVFEKPSYRLRQLLKDNTERELFPPATPRHESELRHQLDARLLLSAESVQNDKNLYSVPFLDLDKIIQAIHDLSDDKEKPLLVFVDYLQKIRGYELMKLGNEQRLAEISSRLAETAKETNAIIIGATQFNRENQGQADDNGYVLGNVDLVGVRGSDAFAYDADVAFSLGALSNAYKPNSSRKVFFSMQKNRQGERHEGNFELPLALSYSHLGEMEYIEPTPLHVKKDANGTPIPFKPTYSASTSKRKKATTPPAEERKTSIIDEDDEEF